MKKIMFNDKYGLTEAVLEGRKTMTRRAIAASIGEVHYRPTVSKCYFFSDSNDREVDPRYHIGEVVAIAQNYAAAGFSGNEIDREPITLKSRGLIISSKGWNNKMFVRAEAMPHHIRITDIKVERMQDISDEDCIKEGVNQYNDGVGFWVQRLPFVLYSTPRKAFAALIDKVSGKGTWDSNPWVFAYTFRLED